jgi:acetyltransferase-like isoleucine patch superfamily enzyme
MTIIIDSSARVSALADLEDSIRGTKIVIGAHSVVDSYVKIKPAGGFGDVIVGEHSFINSGCVIYTGNGLRIGDSVAVAANCVFAPVNHEFSDAARHIRDQGFKPSKGGIVVEDDVWIGAGCVILDGAILRRGCVIAAMSLVRGEIAPYSIQGGNPLQLIGWRR